MSLTEKVYNKILQARKKPKLIISNTPTGMSLYGVWSGTTLNFDPLIFKNENYKTSSNRNS